jgi:hypothetical protein
LPAQPGASYRVRSDVRVRSTAAPELALVLLTVPLVIALTADTRIASAASDGAGTAAGSPPAAQAYEIEPGPAP